MMQKFMIVMAMTLGMACLAKAEKAIIAFPDLNIPMEEHMNNLIKCGTEISNPQSRISVLIQKDKRTSDLRLVLTQIQTDQKNRNNFQVRSVDNERLGGASFQGSMLDLVINWNSHEDAIGVPAVLKVGNNSVKVRCMKILPIPAA